MASGCGFANTHTHTHTHLTLQPGVAFPRQSECCIPSHVWKAWPFHQMLHQMDYTVLILVIDGTENVYNHTMQCYRFNEKVIQIPCLLTLALIDEHMKSALCVQHCLASSGSSC